MKTTRSIGYLYGGAVMFMILFGWRYMREAPPRDALPNRGERLPLQSIGEAFGRDLVGRSWVLLILSASCSACLGLDDELETLKQTTRCSGSALLPLIVPMGQSPDSMRNVLARHGITNVAVGSSEVLNLLRTRSVPTAIVVDDSGIVRSVANPMIANTWPPKETCVAGRA